MCVCVCVCVCVCARVSENFRNELHLVFWGRGGGGGVHVKHNCSEVCMKQDRPGVHVKRPEVYDQWKK